MLKKRNAAAFVLTFLLCLPVKVFADDTAYVVARDFKADGKVLELDVPRQFDGIRFFFIFQNAGSESHVQYAVAREGTHCYETRHFPGWKGPMNLIAIGLKDVAGRVKEPSVADDVDMFFEPDRLISSTVNHVAEHRLAACSWIAVLFLVFAASTIFLRVRKSKSLPAAAVLGFVVAWALMDWRILIDHAATVYKEETLHRGVPALHDATLFADQAAGIVGGGTWSVEDVTVGQSLIKYRLAEHPYAPPGSTISADIRVTGNPAGPVLLHYGEYYLVKKQIP